MTAIVERIQAARPIRANPTFTAVAIRLTACVATVAAVLTVLAATPAGTRSVALPVYVAGVIIVFGVGLYDFAQQQDARFAQVLIVGGFLWSLSAMSASSDPLLYSLGRIGLWFVQLAIVYVLLSYPSGRLRHQNDRALFAGGALLVGLLYLPTALITPQFPHPSLWSQCLSGCPPNAFALGHSTPGFVHTFVIPLRQLLTVALFVTVAVAVTQHRRNAGPLLRREYTPIVLIAVFEMITFVFYFPIRDSAASSGIVTVLGWVNVLGLPAVALACGVGRLSRRVQAATTLDRLAQSVRASATPSQVRGAMADALDDPSLRIVHSFPHDSGGWIDESGSAVMLAQYAAGRAVTEVESGNWRIAVVHDVALTENGSLVHTAATYALAALENNHLTGDLGSLLEQLAKARAQGIAAEDRERQKIERDLHDGAQQRLVAVRLKLGLAAEQLKAQDPAGADVLRALGADIDATIDVVRSFARGIYPPLLAETGLEASLRAISRDAALPTTVNAPSIGRYRPEIEAAVYFSCSEALQNAAKHAWGATAVTISVWQDGELHFEVRDDGAGFDPGGMNYGTGLTNLHERLAAVNGMMTIHSTPGQGTEVAGSVPLR